MTNTVHLIIQYANTDNAARQAEFDYCVRANLANPHVAAVHNLVEPQTVVPGEFGSHPKYIEHPQARWLRYGDAFAYAAEVLPGEVVALVNLDIFLNPDSPWDALGILLDQKVVLALGRYEFDPANPTMTPDHPAPVNSQDAWVFRAPFMPDDCDFEIGRWECDNAIAERIFRSGRTPLNWRSLFKVMHCDTVRGKSHDNAHNFHRTDPDYRTPAADGEFMIPAFTSRHGLEHAPQLLTANPRILTRLMAEINEHTAYSLEMSRYVKANL